jgi:hypothetical protein
MEYSAVSYPVLVLTLQYSIQYRVTHSIVLRSTAITGSTEQYGIGYTKPDILVIELIMSKSIH